MPAPLTDDDFSGLMVPVMPRAGAPVAVAVSGGADSLALTLLLGRWCAARDVPLTAITVDHGLRADSAQEARQVAAWLKKYDIPHIILTWSGDKPRSNIQDRARLARYHLMGQWCQENRVRRLFLGHHQGDQAETFLIRLFRGSGVDGLSAMKIQSDYPLPFPGLVICRPLLYTARERLAATLREIDQVWIEDPSNRDEHYTRVKIRNLLQHNDIEGLGPQRMAQTAARMGRVQSLLKSLTDRVTAEAATVFPEGYARINPEILLAAHEEIALRTLAALLRRVGGGDYAPRLAKLEALYERVKVADFAGQTLAGCRISARRAGHITISREGAAIQEERDLDAGSVTLWDGRFLIENRRVAGRLKKLGDAGWRQVRQENPDLENPGLPGGVRESLPCIIPPDGRVILPDFMPGFAKTGFRATFRQ